VTPVFVTPVLWNLDLSIDTHVPSQPAIRYDRS
jgi:hypothetical protein